MHCHLLNISAGLCERRGNVLSHLGEWRALQRVKGKDKESMTIALAVWARKKIIWSFRRLPR
jgi:hypothetical protein